MTHKKLYICGYGAKNRSRQNEESTGKDTAAKLINRHLGYSFASSSWIACQHVIYPKLKDKFGYQSIDQCYNDRHNNRTLWHNLIAEYNKKDNAHLSKNIFAEYDIYAGIRKIEEFKAAYEQNIVDLSIWIDASKRVEIEDSSSCTVTADDCDIIIANNGTIAEFEQKIERLCNFLK